MRTGFAWLLAVVLCCGAGCSGSGMELAEVSGTVQLDGQLIEEGSIQFIPVDGTNGPGAGGIIKNGRYRITRDKGVVVGRNRVELRAFRKASRMVADPTGKPGTRTEERVQAFPPDFNDQSTVVKDIVSGSNTMDFDVQTKLKGK
jgi:hypothetical protein